jgi:putative colanic acid biosynthesis acetyltransferase WcaF
VQRSPSPELFREASNGEESLQIRVGATDCPSPHSLRNKVGRVVWAVVYAVAFRPSPRLFYGWRRLLLRWFGASVGRNARVDPSTRFWAPWNMDIGEEASLGPAVYCYCVSPIWIGAHATISQEAFLCTASHDVTDPHMRLTHAPIRVEDEGWVCARAYIGPGVTISRGAVVGACSVVTRLVAPWTIVAGNPARPVGPRMVRSPRGGPNDPGTAVH